MFSQNILRDDPESAVSLSRVADAACYWPAASSFPKSGVFSMFTAESDSEMTGLTVRLDR